MFNGRIVPWVLFWVKTDCGFNELLQLRTVFTSESTPQSISENQLSTVQAVDPSWAEWAVWLFLFNWTNIGAHLSQILSEKQCRCVKKKRYILQACLQIWKKFLQSYSLETPSIVVSSLTLGRKMNSYVFLQYLSRDLGKAMAEGTGAKVGVLGLTSPQHPASSGAVHLVGIQQCLPTQKSLPEQKRQPRPPTVYLSEPARGHLYTVQHLRLNSSRNQKIGKIPKQPLGEMKCGKELHSNLIESKAIPLWREPFG